MTLGLEKPKRVELHRRAAGLMSNARNRSIGCRGRLGVLRYGKVPPALMDRFKQLVWPTYFVDISFWEVPEAGVRGRSPGLLGFKPIIATGPGLAAI